MSYRIYEQLQDANASVLNRCQARVTAFFFLLAAVLIGMTAQPVAAAPFYAAQTTFGRDVSGSAPVFTSGSQNHPPGTFDPFSSLDYSIREGSAKAGPGVLGARAVVDLYFPEAFPFFSSWVGNVSSSARFIVDDLVLSGPAGTVSGTLQLHLSGGASANAVLLGATSSAGRASASVSIGGAISGPSFNSSFLGSMSVVDDTSGGPQTTTSGILASGPGLISIPLNNVPVGVPLMLDLHLSTHAHAIVFGTGFSGWDNVAATGYSSFFDTLTFNTNGPVFLLPDGYTADSLSAEIHDNVFVPEASSFTLLSLGGATLLCIARRRTCRGSLRL